MDVLLLRQTVATTKRALLLVVVPVRVIVLCRAGLRVAVSPVLILVRLKRRPSVFRVTIQLRGFARPSPLAGGSPRICDCFFLSALSLSHSVRRNSWPAWSVRCGVDVTVRQSRPLAFPSSRLLGRPVSCEPLHMRAGSEKVIRLGKLHGVARYLVSLIWFSPPGRDLLASRVSPLVFFPVCSFPLVTSKHEEVLADGLLRGRDRSADVSSTSLPRLPLCILHLGCSLLEAHAWGCG